MKWSSTLFNKRKTLALGLCASLGTVLGAFAQEQVVKIGHVAPLSGPIAHLGKDNENGARMAIEELNAKGISIGGKKIKFELSPKTTAQTPSKAPRLHKNWWMKKSKA